MDQDMLHNNYRSTDHANVLNNPDLGKGDPSKVLEKRLEFGFQA